jgi:hypothetical protein
MEHSKRLAHLIGQRFGRLTVKEVYKKELGANSARALCGCDCGTIRTFETHSLHRGASQSCGCVTVERMTGNTIHKTHGEGDWRHGKRTPEYTIWLDMRWRCQPTNEATRKDYFEKGVRVCERWNSYENFLADMGRKTGPKYEIDRYPNENGNYEPGNCRWATEKEQTRNRRTTPYTYFDGEYLTLAEIAERLHLPYIKIWMRTVPVEWDSPEDEQVVQDEIHRKKMVPAPLTASATS